MLLVYSWQKMLFQPSHAQGEITRLDAQRPRSITKAGTRGKATVRAFENLGAGCCHPAPRAVL